METAVTEGGWGRIGFVAKIAGFGLLMAHFYYFCHFSFHQWHLSCPVTDKAIQMLANSGIFKDFGRSKYGALLLLVISATCEKENTGGENRWHAVILVLTGISVYFSSAIFLLLDLTTSLQSVGYIALCITGLLLFMRGAPTLISLMETMPDPFNHSHESFPQQEIRMDNPFSINLPSRFRFKGREKKGWINIINPFRGLLVLGTPGSGKSHFVIREVIRQHICKGFSMLVYDFKYDDLSRIAYQHYISHASSYPAAPQFHIIHFDDLARSSRCNPLEPQSMKDITDAAEAARTIMLGLNQEWIRRQGDFFVESPIHFVTALIWFLCCYQQGKYCTLPHVVELARVPYDKLFTLLNTEPETQPLIHPFITAYLHNAMEQLEGQIASATISLSRLSSPNLYYLLTGKELSLDIGNPLEPKILCIGNNSRKSSTYGPVAALYITAVARLLNVRGNLKSSLVFDEFPTIYLGGIDRLMATARSNRVATTLAVQDASQLRLYYGRDLADVILNITGNVISGQVSGDTARQLAERFGRIIQETSSLSVHESSSSVTRSSHLEQAIPASRIASLSTGEFVGLVTDDLEHPVEQKIFHGKLGFQAPKKQKPREIPQIPKKRVPDPEMIKKNYQIIREDITEMVQSEMARILSTPSLSHLIVKK
jgi:hypothetical protein